MKKIENYSQAVKELENIVQNIENNIYDIDILSEKIKEATAFLVFCKQKLKETDEEIVKLLEKIG
jgi:exodeoxyribonuclease VII small subunit